MRMLAVSILVIAAMVFHPLAAEDEVAPEDDSPYDEAEHLEMEGDPSDESGSWGADSGEDATEDWGQEPDYAVEEDAGNTAATDAAYTDNWTEDSEAAQASDAASDAERMQGEPETSDQSISSDPHPRTEGSNRAMSQGPNPSSGAPASPDTGDSGAEGPGSLGERVTAITRELDAELAVMAGQHAQAMSQPRLGEINQRLNQAIDWVNQAAERGQLKEARDASLPLATGCQQWKPRLESVLRTSNEAQQTQLREAIEHCEQIIEARHKLPN